MFVTKLFKVYELTVQPPKIEGVFDLFAKRNSETIYFKSLDEAKQFSDTHYPGRECHAKTRDAFYFEGKCQVLVDAKKPKYSRPVKFEDRKIIGESIKTTAKQHGTGSLVAAKLVGNSYQCAEHTRILSDAECFIIVGDPYTNTYARGPGGSEQCFHYHQRELKYTPIQLQETVGNELKQAPGVRN